VFLLKDSHRFDIKQQQQQLLLYTYLSVYHLVLHVLIYFILEYAQFTFFAFVFLLGSIIITSVCC